MMGKRGKIVAFAALSAVVFAMVPQARAEKTVVATIKTDTIEVGNQAGIETSGDVTFQSSDTLVACVNDRGVVTGKKQGTVTITVKRKGYQSRQIAINVVKTKKNPNLPVAVDEVAIVSQKLEADENGNMIFSAVIKNMAKKGKIKKVIVSYQAEVAVSGSAVSSGAVSENGKTSGLVVSLTAKNIRAEKKSKVLTCKGDVSGDLRNMKLKSIEVYSGEALHCYDGDRDSYKMEWGTPDTKAPKITGWVGKDSINKGEAFRVYYADRKDSYNFKKYVSASDDRSGKVRLKADTDKINWDKEGVYKIRYTATDVAGNTAKAWAKVQVLKKSDADDIADQILSSITQEGWSDERKARAVYSYVKAHCSYVDNGSHSDWRKVAANGFRYQSGDCFTYYAMSRALFTRAGIPNITITRNPVTSAHHWWNLVYVHGGWYHFDTTPRSTPGYFCLETDAQMKQYKGGAAHRYVSGEYPQRATKIISKGPNE